MDGIDDKSMVIIAVTSLAMMSMFLLPDSEGLISNVVAGLFGIAVGKRI